MTIFGAERKSKKIRKRARRACDRAKRRRGKAVQKVPHERSEEHRSNAFPKFTVIEVELTAGATLLARSTEHVLRELDTCFEDLCARSGYASTEEALWCEIEHEDTRFIAIRCSRSRDTHRLLVAPIVGKKESVIVAAYADVSPGDVVGVIDNLSSGLRVSANMRRLKYSTTTEHH